MMNSDNMTIKLALQLGKDRLSSVMPTAEAVKEAGYLLSAVLGEDRAMLLAFAEKPLSRKQEQCYRAGLQGRADGKPLALIRGSQEFYGRDFACEASLIPRPDSESVVELALKLLPAKDNLQILDIGCGSGCLGISVAKECNKQVHLTLADADMEALKSAEQNAKQHLGEAYKTQLSNWFADVSGSFDVILCNPPYIASDDLAYLPRGVRKFEPTLALNGGEDGLQAYEVLAESVKAYLHQGGILVLEIGSGQGESVQKLFTSSGLAFIGDAYDLGGLQRSLAFKRSL